MENMDSTVIATSLAAIAEDIGTDPISLKLALTAYLVALAIFIPISSWMADRFGARRVFRVAMLVFMIGSIACAFSSSLAQFVGARFVQGMGGAMMGPVARLVLVRMTPRHQLVDAMAWLTIPALIGPIVGAFLLTALAEGLREVMLQIGVEVPGVKQVFYGFCLLWVVMFLPDGVWPPLSKLLGFNKPERED